MRILKIKKIKKIEKIEKTYYCSKFCQNKIKKLKHNNNEKIFLGAIKPIFSILELMEKGDYMTKKILIILAILSLLFFTLQISVFAASVPLGSVAVNVSKAKIAPGEEVTVNINFGTQLGAYTFDIAYDNSIFDFVSAEGGTENDNGTRVRVTFYDSTGGISPRENMSVTFKAKAELESTNPTDFSVTAEGLANSDASQEYDDITSPIKKSVTVEPNYVDYTLDLNYTGDVVVNKEKNMELITSSSMGKNYDHVKMKVEITEKPSDSATVKLLATERTRQEIDLIQEGWGEPDGYELGGRDAEQVLELRGLFSEVGNYKIKVSLLDADTGNAEIVSKEFAVVVNKESTTTPEDNNQNENTGNNNGNNSENNEIIGNNNANNDQNGNGQTEEGQQGAENIQNEEMPETLPKTGMTQYVYFITAIAILGTSYIAVKNFKKEK